MTTPALRNTPVNRFWRKLDQLMDEQQLLWGEEPEIDEDGFVQERGRYIVSVKSHQEAQALWNQIEDIQKDCQIRVPGAKKKADGSYDMRPFPCLKRILEPQTRSLILRISTACKGGRMSHEKIPPFIHDVLKEDFVLMLKRALCQPSPSDFPELWDLERIIDDFGIGDDDQIKKLLDQIHAGGAKSSSADPEFEKDLQQFCLEMPHQIARYRHILNHTGKYPTVGSMLIFNGRSFRLWYADSQSQKRVYCGVGGVVIIVEKDGQSPILELAPSQRPVPKRLREETAFMLWDYKRLGRHFTTRWELWIKKEDIKEH